MSGSVLARVDPDAARRTARGIVESRSYRPEAVPKPLEGVLRWIGDRLEPVGRLLQPIVDFFSQGFGRILFVLLLVAVVVAIAWWVTRVRADVGGPGRARDEGRARRRRAGPGRPRT